MQAGIFRGSGPERFRRASGFERGQSRVFVEVQCAALDPRIATLVTLVHCHLHAALLYQSRQREAAWPSADDGDLLSMNGAHTYLRILHSNHEPHQSIHSKTCIRLIRSDELRRRHDPGN